MENFDNKRFLACFSALNEEFNLYRPEDKNHQNNSRVIIHLPAAWEKELSEKTKFDLVVRKFDTVDSMELEVDYEDFGVRINFRPLIMRAVPS